jgi:hypothetical protein
LAITVRIEGGRETLAAFRRLPREASTALRERSLELAKALAGRVQSSATGDSPQSALMATTVKAKRDRIPVIEAGGTTRVGSSRVPAYKVLFGSEFGARTLPQYRPHVGRGSYWMFRTVEDNEAMIAAGWLRAADDIVRAFGEGG